ncbi:MAG: isoprenylcysteine carboxylmethyltransferase family protein [Spirochaetes bacterium]|nr:isoprenylcysteine carboxylmethyltransferase family protein [Spirochaetota bacterium]
MRNRIHHGREDLTGEHLVGDAGQIILAIIFLSAWIADTFFLKATTFLNAYISIFIRIPIGIIIMIVGCYLSITGLSIIFGEVRVKPEVIRKSVFGIVRHPIYLAEILCYLGMLMFSISLIAAFICILTIIFLHCISRYEEKLLLARFKDDYKKYIDDVPMWIPRFSKLFGNSPLTRGRR